MPPRLSIKAPAWRKAPRPTNACSACWARWRLSPRARHCFWQLLTPLGLSLDFFSAASLIATAVIALTLLACLRIPVENLLLLLFPLGMLTALTSQFAPPGTVPLINEEPGILAHILLSILAYGMFTIAVFQALLLLLQDHQLKHKHPSGLIKNFPPLQTMESLLFGFLWAGWGCCRCR